jgi:tRNA threonylcarbamoyladenosine biosynthesis protein TsaE
MSERIIITNSKEETVTLAERFAQTLKTGDFLAFYGDLGSGKTTFIQGLAKGLGIRRRIVSPTFIIVRTYDSRSKIQDSRFKTFYHIDLYRTASKNDLLGLGINEIIQNPNNIVALEWAEKLGEMLPKRRIDVYMEYLREDQRKITIEKYE